jgi:acetoacetyl-CoA synthetase
VGELVCTEPMPSMPLFLWGDADGKRYRDSYFDTYPNAWRHGDWIRITPRGGAIIYGRSDATINRYGIRMGTSELYRVVEELPEVLDSMVVDLEYPGRESYMPLFVVLREGMALDDALRDTLRARIRVALSSRHVPNEILQVPGVPRTLSGKRWKCRSRNCCSVTTREDRQPRCHGESRVPDVVLRVRGRLPGAARAATGVRRGVRTRRRVR